DFRLGPGVVLCFIFLLVDVGGEFLEGGFVLVVGRLKNLAGLGQKFPAFQPEFLIVVLVGGRIGFPDLHAGLFDQNPGLLGIGLRRQRMVGVGAGESIQLGHGPVELFLADLGVV